MRNRSASLQKSSTHEHGRQQRNFLEPELLRGFESQSLVSDDMSGLTALMPLRLPVLRIFHAQREVHKLEPKVRPGMTTSVIKLGKASKRHCDLTVQF